MARISRTLSTAGFATALTTATIVAALVLTSTSLALTGFRGSPSSLPPPPAASNGPRGVEIVLTAIVGQFHYSNGSSDGWLGSSGQELNLSASLAGPPPYRFPGGQFVDWEIRLTNQASQTGYVYSFSTSTAGVNWGGAVGGTYFSIPANQTILEEVRLTLPYQNYSGPLTFNFSVG